MTVDLIEDDPASQSAAAAATVARVLEEVCVRPERIEYEAGEEGAVLARVVIEEGVSQLLCSLNRDGDLISVRLIGL